MATNLWILIPANPKFETAIHNHYGHLWKVYFVLDIVLRAFSIVLLNPHYTVAL